MHCGRALRCEIRRADATFRAADCAIARSTARSVRGCRMTRRREIRRTAVADSQSRVDRFALEREHAEHAFVHAIQRLVLDEAVQRLDAECEFA